MLKQRDPVKEFGKKNNEKVSSADLSQKDTTFSNQSRIPRPRAEERLIEITNLPKRLNSHKKENVLHMKKERNLEKIKRGPNTATPMTHQVKFQLPLDDSTNRSCSETVPQMINQLRTIVHTMDENLSDVKDLITRLSIDYYRLQDDNEPKERCNTIQRSRSGI